MGLPLNDGGVGVADGTHRPFFADSRTAAEAFQAAGHVNGASDDGARGLVRNTVPSYYGCFLRDPDGQKIEATFWDQTLAGRSRRHGSPGADRDAACRATGAGL